mmetsp:Transcript_67609/g.176039  ORF Transcript_67609/g.176039 Transcript_67609/m.176039 type:complete len:99 (-) Transcript_67609:142-438(-)
MPLAMHLVVLDDLKGFQAVAARRCQVGPPPSSADGAGPPADVQDSLAHQKLAVAVAAGSAAGAMAGPCPEALRPATAGHTVSSALRARAAALLARSCR